jgi:uncharacterized membrane protein YbaN (DUF454 family)
MHTKSKTDPTRNEGGTTALNRFKKRLWTALGTLFLGLGIIGIFLPLLPTTPFLLLAAACYLRGSESRYQWLINNKWFGEYIRNYHEKKGIPLRIKVFAITFLWITISFTAFFVIGILWITILLIIIATAVTVHILRFKTL